MATDVRFLIAFMLAWLQVTSSIAQAPANLEKMHVQAGITVPFYKSVPFNYYSNSTGISLQSGVNYLEGEIFLSAAVVKYHNDSLNDYFSSLFGFGYAYDIRLYKQIIFKPAISFGNHYMRFSDRLLDKPIQKESELMIAIQLQVMTPVYKNFHFITGVGYTRTYTYHRFNMIGFHAGIRYTLATPKIIKHFIE